HLCERLAPGEVHVEIVDAAIGEMRVRIVEARHHEVPAQVDHLGVLALQLFDFSIRSNRYDTAFVNSNGLNARALGDVRPGDNLARRLIGIARDLVYNRSRVDIAVDKDDVGRLLLVDDGVGAQGDDDCNQEEIECWQERGCTRSKCTDHSTPASVSMVSRTRLSPRSRPAGSYHSCSVCAPPPVPPAPMLIASIPIESGMFASVDARCTRAWLPRCVSTARITCNTRAVTGSSAAGRDPINCT